MTKYMKSCSFLHAHFFELMNVVENLFFLKKLMVKNSFIFSNTCCRYTLELPCVPTTYVTEHKKTI